MLHEVVVVAAVVPLRVDELSRGERARHDALATPARRREWLTGRRAIKLLARRIGLDDDTARLRFPNRWVSVSHSGGIAVAAGHRHGAIEGVGVDVERRSSLRAAGARFFLDDHERATAATDDLVRLWTVKEALFKANIANHGTALLDYHVDDVHAQAGRATGPEGCPPLVWETRRVAAGTLAVAAAIREDAAC